MRCADHEKKMHGLGQDEEHDFNSTLFVGAVTTEVQIKNEKCYAMMTAQGHIKKVKVDNDSQVNKMPFKEHKKIAGSSPHMEICTHKLVSYSNDKLSVLGTVKLPVKFNAGVEQELTLNIAETNQPEINQPPNSTQDLGSIKVVLKTKPEEKLTKPSQSEIKTKSSQELQEEALQNCSQVFTGLGRLEKPYNIEVTPQS